MLYGRCEYMCSSGIYSTELKTLLYFLVRKVFQTQLYCRFFFFCLSCKGKACTKTICLNTAGKFILTLKNFVQAFVAKLLEVRNRIKQVYVALVSAIALVFCNCLQRLCIYINISPMDRLRGH
ncbi:uncharacterized protein RHIMIDRAFT_13361 [Rhizopus microsporus ATCC 52813]|uniref:Uncharacterized protein n=1 Tax=Rhizopus microsporus ATCC 52813 TaxID=1340429 RepID=A0A2G4TA39_RHIZD|nr:uncharacterized protein RHIMIDRAFT_13361 [Rhizopus microsporus ATCC 52813]PHZ17882.1 hypothetical protein RHIMIDRAFT_13361 [Rhizopus microsporus ATCC 52813]